jgi:hypothetical protein
MLKWGLLLYLSVLLVLVSVGAALYWVGHYEYAQGYANGRADGYQSGQVDGYHSGYAAGYHSGYANGSTQAVEQYIQRSCRYYPFLLLDLLDSAQYLACKKPPS